jgi:signal transduction histidine kinase
VPQILFKECKKYKIPLWQCPQFLFFIIGLLIVFGNLALYFLGPKFIQDPLILLFVISLFTIILLTINYFIVHFLEKTLDLSILKSQFLNIISHHLNSPLTNIKWILEYLISKDFSVNEKEEYFLALKDNLERIRDMLGKFNLASQIDLALKKLKLQKVSISEITQKNLQKIQPSFSVEVKTEIEPNLPEILTDPFFLDFVIFTLLDNAFRYTQDRVEIKIAKKRGKIYFEVKDNGIGIEEKEKKHIFERFYRGKEATLKWPFGIGLGLYLSKIFIQKLGGEIGFNSKKDKGSTFWFYLPIK